MHRIILILIVLFNTNVASTQLYDDFSDSDLSSNPTWNGDLESFVVNDNQELQLDHPQDEGGIKSIYSLVEFPDSLRWTLKSRMNFDPSINNQLRVYLMADASPALAENGYYFEIGENGANDAIHFYALINGSENLLFSFEAGQVSSNPDFTIQLTRSSDGQWDFYSDYTNSGILNSEGNIFDFSILPKDCNFFGITTKFTKSNRSKFFFDDIQIAPILPDTEGPKLLNHEIIDGSSIHLTFNEPLDESSVNTLTHYNLSNIGPPNSAELDVVDPRIVKLSFPVSMVSGVIYVLDIEQISDLSDNLIIPESIQFQYILVESANQYDIVINEINPTTKGFLAVPNVEYIELFNRTTKYISLQNYSIASGGTPQILPDYIIGPRSYVLICDKDDELLFSSDLDIISLDAFPQLTDGGDFIELRNDFFTLIDHVEYSRFWHDSDDFYEEGYSLERINPNLPCENENNWASCRAAEGGTPAAQNNVFNDISVGTTFDLVEVVPQSNSEIFVEFSHKINILHAEDPLSYTIDPSIQIVEAILLDDNHYTVSLLLSEELQPSVNYELNILNTFQQCDGSIANIPIKKQFGIPGIPEPGDIIINELLFNPISGGEDFVEIYNNSDKFFNLSSLYISNTSYSPPQTQKINTSKLIYPGEYFAFSPNPQSIALHYLPEAPNQILAQPLPSFLDEEGNCSLYYGDPNQYFLLESFDYSEALHNELISNGDGISLERISFESHVNEPANWTSAAAVNNFGTPGYENSQFLSPTAANPDNFFWMDNRRISPDNDGFEDQLFLHYNLDKAGYIAHVKIFNSEGQFINTLVNNELLGSKGFLRWDGHTINKEKAKMGIYIILIELTHPGGEIFVERLSCVVAAKL